MELSSAALVANGQISKHDPLISKIKTYPYLIAVDGGLNSCYMLGLVPNFIIGDLDSVQIELISKFETVPRKTFPKDKDKTDLELAIEHAFSLGAQKITVFGALGGRTDHTIFNVHLLSRYPNKLFFESAEEKLFTIGKSTTLNCHVGQTISLLPLNGPVTGITTHGLKWELSDATLDKHFMGISNVALQEKVSIDAAEGDLLCVVNLSNLPSLNK
ncbi:MAG: thiamine diphosphokinase [Chlamydiales bacterium]|nr:thiamine diphosphokinase [Chlamydiales bacterium]